MIKSSKPQSRNQSKSKRSKSKKSNPERNFKQELENLERDKVRIEYKYGYFIGILLNDHNQPDYFYVSSGRPGYPEGHANISFTDKDIKNIFSIDKEIILK